MILLESNLDNLNPLLHPQRTTQFKHYKGGIYTLICEATNEADLQPVVVYQSADGQYWTRPRNVFFEKMIVGGKETLRFTPI